MIPPSKSKLGFSFNGNSQQKRGTYEIDIANYLKNYIFNFELLINVGANTGYWPCYTSFIHDLKVIAIEPDNFNVIRHKINRHWNHFNNIEILKVACGRESGLVELHGFGTGISGLKGWAGGNSKRMRVVKQIHLDSLFEKIEMYRKKILILIDAEGMEWEILNGASDLMSLDPVFIVEISTTEHQPKPHLLNPNFFRTFEFMSAKGYIAKTWIDGNLIKIDDLLLTKIAQGELETSTNNMFIFEAAGE